MSLELMMNENGQLDHASGSLVSGGEFTITSVPSVQTKSEGVGAYRGSLVYTFAGGSAGGFAEASVATVISQIIEPTALLTKDAGLPVLRLGDSGVMAAVGVIDPPATPPTGPVVGGVEVSDAGQTTARGQ